MIRGHKYTTREHEEIYVLYYDGKPMHVQTSAWNQWRPAKKVYFKLGHARSGITNLPKQVDRSKVTVVKYSPDRSFEF